MNGLRTGSLHAKIGSNWVPVKQWLLSMQSPERLQGEKGYRAQRKWWKLKGQKFTLIVLPTELRLKILRVHDGTACVPADNTYSPATYSPELLEKTT